MFAGCKELKVISPSIDKSNILSRFVAYKIKKGSN